MNERARARAMLSEIDTDGEPIALSANESHTYQMTDGTQLTIGSSSIYLPMFMRYCAMMRRSDILVDPRYATEKLRRENLASLLAEVRAWLTIELKESKLISLKRWLGDHSRFAYWFE